MDKYLEDADPLVQVAIVDVYFELTEDDYHEDDLIAVLANAARLKDQGQEFYLAARLALGRVQGEPLDAFSDVGVEIVGVRTRARPRRGAKRKGARRPRVRDSITVIIDGTWATNGTWWRKPYGAKTVASEPRRQS